MIKNMAVWWNIPITYLKVFFERKYVKIADQFQQPQLVFILAQ